MAADVDIAKKRARFTLDDDDRKRLGLPGFAQPPEAERLRLTGADGTGRANDKNVDVFIWQNATYPIIAYQDVHKPCRSPARALA